MDEISQQQLTLGGTDSGNAQLVPGGKSAREVAEQTRINDLGGVKKLDNKRNPIGKKRQHLLENQRPKE